MKIFNRTYLPDELKYNGKTLTQQAAISALVQNDPEARRAIEKLKAEGKTAALVKVLSRRAKQATDLRGNPYKPSYFIFSN